MKTHPDLEQLALIRPEERDFNLGLQSPGWGAGLTSWTPHRKPARHFSRVLPIHVDEKSHRGESYTKLHEYIVPFPSASIHGINRKAEYGKSLDRRPNMHTVRVLRRPGDKPIHRLFILHNGLNETDSLGFYYRLADWILSQQEELSPEEGAACLIKPFPGHLMHASFHGPFSETPLSRYLSDSGDLFRQFLRYMVGMRWLLSCVADSDVDQWMVGGDLLKRDSLVKDLLVESTFMHKMSTKRLQAANRLSRQQTGAESHQIDIGKVTTHRQIDASDRLLRWALKRDAEGSPKSMRVHVIGYSLGGFVAQSVFFAWPQVISSCTTICSGGALSALSPTAFAQPEEWQSVLHSLRPELSNSMLQGRLGSDDRKKDVPVSVVAGMPIERFGYFQRIFEQVFLQEDRSSYQERLSEYGLRMLFVSGGEDPIVPPKNILDASPREGTTMLSIAGMTHFLNQEPTKDRSREIEQRDFWLPEAGRLIARAAIHSERVQCDEREVAGELNSEQGSKQPDVAYPRRPRGSNLLTDSNMFESAMDRVIGTVTDKGGWLIACRNTLPAALVGEDDLIRWGMALHHHDVRIQQYVAGLRHRAETLDKAMKRTTLIFPEQLEHWFVDLSARFDPHSDGPMGRMTTREDRHRIWCDFETTWRQNIRQFEAGKIADPLEGMDVDRFAATIAKWQEVDGRFMEITHLPDVWIGIREQGEIISTNSDRSTEIHSQIVGGVERLVEEELQRTLLAPELELLNDIEGLEKLEHHKKQLEKDIQSEKILVVQVSGAEFNPRYRGKIETSTATVMRMLAWCAAGLVRSKQMGERPKQEQTG